jgi:integrase
MNSRALVKTSDKGIFKRGNRYVVLYRDPLGKQRKQAARTLAEARTLRATLTADIKRGEYRELSRTTFVEFAPGWAKQYAGATNRGVGEGTRQDYAAALGLDAKTFEPLSPTKRAVAFFGRMRLTAIELRHVKQYVAELEAEGLSPASVAKYVAPLRVLFGDALGDGLIRVNPTAGLRLSRRRREDNSEGEEAGAEQVKALSEEDLQAFLAAVDSTWRLFFEFLSQSGLRIGEAIELRHSDLEGCWLHVQRRYYRGKVGLPKGRKKRRVRLTEDMARKLWQLRKDTHAGSGDLMFPAGKGGRIWPSNLLTRTVKPAAVRVGLGEMVKTADGERAESWVGCHTFRHTAATRLFRGYWDDDVEGYVGAWNAAQVCKFLGHTDPGFTLRTYVHLLPEDLPEPVFGGIKGASQPTEIGRNDEASEAPDSAQNLAVVRAV